MKNAKLWKRILHEGVMWYPVDAYRGYGNDQKKLEKYIITSPIIVSPVNGDNDNHGSEDFMESLGSLAIPFKDFWVEGQICDDSNSLWGVLVCTDKKDDGFTVVMVQFRAGPGIPPEDYGSVTFDLDKNGKVITPHEKAQVMMPASLIGAATKLGKVQEVYETAGMPSWFAAVTLSLMACKNVYLSPRDSESKTVRRAQKWHGLSATGYRYHVLVVRPAGAKSDHPGEEIGMMPHHVCRGHFAEYGPEFNKGLLFGRLAGRFYIPPHMKGDKKNGEVVKDYELAATGMSV